MGYSPDKMLQARLFAYHDAQLYRVGTNHQHLPVNRPRCPFHNQQRDGAMAIANGGAAANYDPVHADVPAAGGFGHGFEPKSGRAAGGHIGLRRFQNQAARLFRGPAYPLVFARRIIAWQNISFTIDNIVDNKHHAPVETRTAHVRAIPPRYSASPA